MDEHLYMWWPTSFEVGDEIAEPNGRVCSVPSGVWKPQVYIGVLSVGLCDFGQQ